MKALKITDRIVIGLFVIGIVLGITQKIVHEITPENNVADAISQLDTTIDPTS